MSARKVSIVLAPLKSNQPQHLCSMRKIKDITLVYILCLVVGLNAQAQEKFTLSGYVKNAKNGEEIIGAVISVKGTSNGVATNPYGFYSLTLPKGKYTIVYTLIGFEPQEFEVELFANKTNTIELSEKNQELKEVEIVSERADGNVKNVEMSVNKLDIKTIKKIPALLGEVDIIRGIQLLPGVSTVGEGAQGFNVRGGGVDQNLVLLDEAPVFNSSHLFGFFSVFNPDAVKDVKLIKGGIPAQYGGRLSSILDVRLNEGNNKKLAVNGGIGLIFSRLTIEAPIVKDKCSFIVAGRRSYIDFLAKPFLRDDLKKSKFYFYDLTAKINYIINDKNRVYASGYLGRDVFSSGFKSNWGNTTTTIRWNHLFNQKLFLNTTVFYSNYDYELVFGQPNGDQFSWRSKIINYSIKPEFTYYANTKNTVHIGGQATLYDFRPGRATFTSGDQSSDISLKDKWGVESAVYLDNEQRIGGRITAQYGLRYSMWQYVGPGKVYSYRDTVPNISKPLDDTINVASGKVIKQYGNLEPRFNIKFDLTESSSIKASYTRISQYLHLVSNTSASTPLDVWTPTTNNIKPQICDQVAAGYFKNFGESNNYESSVEIYYKNMINQVDYIDNANLLLNEYIEAELLNGKGRAYGLELFVKKNKGKFTGWLSYTLARTERKVEGINKGDWYPNRFDKLHNLNLVGFYQFNKKWDMSATFAFATGTPSTFPTNRIVVQGYIIPTNADEKRNNYRIPAYHRLDLSVTRQGKVRKRYESFWVFSVYNVYGRHNAFSVYFQQSDSGTNSTEAIQYSIIARPIPSISYNFKF